jgi:succinate-acetate transporter protein
MAGPISLGLFGLAGAGLVLSGLQLGWVPLTASTQVALVLMAFAFPAQAITGLLSFFARDGAAATAMSVLALSWLTIGLVTATSPPGGHSAALGLLLLLTSVAIALTGVTAANTKVVMALVLWTASLRFLLTAVFHLTGGEGWKTASGLLGLGLTVLAVYAAWASELEDATGKSVLPTGRRGKGLIALHGSLYEQVQDVSAEAGVRARL